MFMQMWTYISEIKVEIELDFLKSQCFKYFHLHVVLQNENG
jgi:hypothetical protein